MPSAIRWGWGDGERKAERALRGMNESVLEIRSSKLDLPKIISSLASLIRD